MPQQIINFSTGTLTLQEIKLGFTRVNENFAEIAAAVGSGISIQVINADADTILQAFTKINQNFSSIYSQVSGNQQVINLGSGPNTNTGDTIIVALNKTDANFTELYSLLGLVEPTPEPEPVVEEIIPDPNPYVEGEETVVVEEIIPEISLFSSPMVSSFSASSGQQIINLGDGPDTQTGDSLYVAFGKVNENFTELYSVFEGNGITNVNADFITANNITVSSNIRAGNLFTYGSLETIGTIVTAGVFYPNGVPIGGVGVIDQSLIPTISNVYSVGNVTNQFTQGFFSSNIVLAGSNVTVSNGLIYVNGTLASGNYGNSNVASYLTVYGGNIAATVTTPNQPYITQLGTLSSLNVAGNTVITGNLDVSGTVTYLNVRDFTVQDPIITLNTGPNGAPLSSNNNFDSGVRTYYFDGANKASFFGRTNSTGYFEYYSNVQSEVGNIVTGTYGTIKSGNVILTGQANITGNVTGNYFLGNGRYLTGIDTTLISNELSNVKVYANGNVAISSNGVSNVAVFTSIGGNIAGDFFVTGTINASNYIGNVQGNLSAPGLNTQVLFNDNNIAGAAPGLTFDKTSNVLTVSGNVTTAGNITVGGYTVIDSSGNVVTSRLIDSGVVAGTYGNASAVPVITVDNKGRITVANTTAVAGVNNVTYDSSTGNLTVFTSAGTNYSIDTGVGTSDSPVFSGLSVSGNSTVNALTVNGSATVGSTLGVTGNLIAGNARIVGTANIGQIDVAGYVVVDSTGNIATARLIDSGVTQGTYGSASAVPVITVDSKGRITFANTTAVAGVNNVTYDTTNGNLTVYTSAGTNYSIDIGVGTSDSPVFSGMTANGNVTASGLTVNNSGTFGTTLDVTGNTIVGNLRTAGTILITNTTNSTGANTGALIVQGGASFEKDIHVLGNVYATNVVAINANTLSVQDPLLYLTANTPYPYNYDIGFYSQFDSTGSNYQHTGFVRDVNDSVWKLFSNVSAEPTITIDFTDAVYDQLLTGTHTVLGQIIGNSSLSLFGTATVGNLVSNGTISATSISLANANINGNLTVNGITVNNSIYAGTTLSAAGGLQATPIGNVSPSTAIFTTQSVSGNSNINALTVNTTATIGSNLGVAGNITAPWILGNIVGNISAPGSTWQVLFNNGGVISADPGLSFNGTQDILTVAGNVDANAITTNSDVTIGQSLRVAGRIWLPLPDGNAPFVITSTTVSENLNADLLDGYHANNGPSINTVAVRDGLGNLVANGIQIFGSGYFTNVLSASGGIQNTPIGNLIPEWGNFTVLGANYYAILNELTVNNSANIGANLGVTGTINGTSLQLTGNQIVNGNITSNGLTVNNSATIGGSLDVTGNISTGNISTTNLTVAGIIAGNITVSNVSLSGGLQNTPVGNAIPSTGNFTTLVANTSATVQTLTVNASATLGNSLVAGGNITANGLTVNNSGTFGTTLGVVGAATVGSLTTAGNITANGLTVNNSGTFGTTLGVVGAATVGSLTTAGNITANGLTVNSSVTIGANLGVSGNIIVGAGSGGNISGLNSISANTISISANATVGNLSTAGNVNAAFFFGNGSQLTGIDATSIQNGTSNVKVYLNGPVTISSGGTANILSVSSTSITASNTFFGTNVQSAQIGNTGTLLTGTLTTAAQPNITSVSNSLTIGEIIIASNAISSTSDTITIEPAGPGNTGNVVIEGNLRVTGNVIAVDSQIVIINDKDILLANNQSTSLGIDGAGVWAGNIAGTPIATFVYNHSTTSWQSNIGITPAANASLSFGGTNNYWATGYFNSIQAPTIVAGTVTAGINGPLNGTLGSAGGNTAIVSTLSATGNATVSALTVNNSATIGSSLGVVGNINGSSLTLSGSVVTTGPAQHLGGLQNTPIGNAIAAAGYFTTLDANANVIVNALTVNNSTTIGGTLGVTGNVLAGNISTNNLTVDGIIAGNISVSNVNLSGGLQNTPVGNAIPSTGNFTTLVANTSVTAQSLAVNNSATVGSDLIVSGNITANGLTINNSGTFGTTLQAQGGIQNTPIGNVTPSTALFTTAGASGNVTAAALTSNASITAQTTLSALGGIQATPIGNVTASSGQFTSLSATGNITGNALTINGSATIGTTLGVGSNIIVGTGSGGSISGIDTVSANSFVAAISFNGPLNGTLGSAGGNTAIVTTLSATGNITGSALTSNSSITAVTTLSALGGIQATPIGNVTASSGQFTTISGTGNITGASITSNASITAQTTLSALGGIQATPIGNVTASTGKFTTLETTGAATVNSLGVNNNSTVGGNLTVSGLVTVNELISNGSVSGTAAQFTTINVSANATVNALTVNNSATIGSTLGVVGNINGSNATLSGSLVTTGTAQHLGGLQATPIGNVTASSASFTTVNTSGNITVGGNISITDNISANTISTLGNATVGNLSTAGNITAAFFFGNGSQLTGIDATSIQNGTSNVKVYPNGPVTISSSGTANVLTVTDLLITSIVAINGTAINGSGNITGSALTSNSSITAVTTLSALGGLQETPIGNVTPSTAIFTTESVSGNSTVNSLTVNSSATIGGTLGIAGNIFGSAGKTFTGLDIISANVFAGTFNGTLNGTIGSAGGNTAIFSAISTTGNATTGQLTVNGTATIGSTLSVAGGIQNTPIGNAVTNSGSFTNLNAATFGNTGAVFTGDTYTGSTFTATNSFNGALNGILGSAGGNSAIISSLTTTGVATVSSLISNSSIVAATSITSGTLVTGAINSNANTTVNSLTVNNSATIGTTLGVVGNINGNGITLSGSGVLAGTLQAQAGLQDTPVGNVTPSTGNFTSLVSSGNIVVANLSVNNSANVSGNIYTGNILTNGYFYANGQPLSISSSGSALILSSNAVGDGSTVAFSLPATSSAAATVVAINGVVQEPFYAYNVAGSTLTFTSAPALNDKIDFRVMTATTVGSLTDAAGTTGLFFDVVSNNKTATFKTAGTTTMELDNNGYLNMKANGFIIATPSITVGTGGGTLDTWSGTTYKAAKYIVTARDSGSTTWTTMEALVATNGVSNAAITVYGIVNAGSSGTQQVTLTATASTGTVTVTATGAAAGTVVNFEKTYMVGS